MRRCSLPALSLSLVAAALLLGAVSAVDLRSKAQTLAQTEALSELEVSARLFEESTVDALDHALARHSHVVRALAEANPLPSMSVADATRFFFAIDKDKEGLDKKEFAAFFSEKAGMSNEQIEEFWAKLDKNENGLVTLTEWLQFFFPGGNASPATTGEREHALKTHDAEVSFDVSKNAGPHHTDPFNQFQITKQTKLIVRRGQPFFLTVTVPAANATEEQAREIFFDFGSFTAKNVGKGALSVTKWGTRFIGFNNSAASASTSSSAARKSLMFQVSVPFNAPIGRYMVKISGPMLQHRELGSVLVLFNPWSSLDEVYMPEKNLLEEYVMEDDTHIYTGDVVDVALKGIHQMGWNLHQYEVLDIVLQLLTDNVPAAALASPSKVARALTWILNTAENPNGVLTGRWDGIYTDGAKPSGWTGSRAIFHQFRDTGKAVKYGQCWVFAALLTSALRAIGVPSRVVTTFRSAHDTPPYDLVIDRTIGESVWNFHVWVDGWFHRRDLNTTFLAKKDRACWNALDATPQEKSDGKYQMGPAALPLIRSNVTNAPFDTMFVIGEANAKVWLGQGTYEVGKDYANMDFDNQDVGQFISTNRPGCNHSPQSANCREDITHQYKFPNTSFPRFNLKKAHAFEASITPEHPVLGESFVITSKRSALMIQKPVWVNVSLTADMITYTGKFLANVKTLVGTCRLHPNPQHKDNTCKDTAGGWRMNVAVQDYLKYLPRTTHFRIVMRIKEYYASDSLKVFGRNHAFKEYVFEKQFTLNLPTVSVSITPPHVEAGRPFQAIVSFLNPLPVALTNITLTLDAPDYDKVAKFDKGSIPARSAASPKKAELVTEQMTASLPGIWPMAVTVTCNQFQGLRGHAHVNVQPNHMQLD